MATPPSVATNLPWLILTHPPLFTKPIGCLISNHTFLPNLTYINQTTIFGPSYSPHTEPDSMFSTTSTIPTNLRRQTRITIHLVILSGKKSILLSNIGFMVVYSISSSKHLPTESHHPTSMIKPPKHLSSQQRC